MKTKPKSPQPKLAAHKPVPIVHAQVSPNYWSDAPPGISPAARLYYDELMKVYDIRDLDGRMTLHAICRAFDRAEGARAQVEKFGPVVLGRDGQLVANPGCAIERDARRQLLAALRHLDIGVAVQKNPRPGKPAKGGYA